MGEEYLRAGFLNANSLKAYIQEIRQFLKDDPSYHLFGIAESKLVQIDGYTLVRQDRKVGGGGVALHVQITLKVKILCSESINNNLDNDNNSISKLANWAILLLTSKFQ